MLRNVGNMAQNMYRARGLLQGLQQGHPELGRLATGSIRALGRRPPPTLHARLYREWQPFFGGGSQGFDLLWHREERALQFYQDLAGDIAHTLIEAPEFARAQFGSLKWGMNELAGFSGVSTSPVLKLQQISDTEGVYPSYLAFYGHEAAEPHPLMAMSEGMLTVMAPTHPRLWEYFRTVAPRGLIPAVPSEQDAGLELGYIFTVSVRFRDEALGDRDLGNPLESWVVSTQHALGMAAAHGPHHQNLFVEETVIPGTEFCRLFLKNFS
jgi:hypothetical protein